MNALARTRRIGRTRSLAFVAWVMPVCLAVLGSVSQADQSKAKFKDVTEQAGLKGIGSARCAWGDYNADGWADLQIRNKLYRNNQRGGFERVKSKTKGRGIWADFDNDGRLDYFSVSDGGRLYHQTGQDKDKAQGQDKAQAMGKTQAMGKPQADSRFKAGEPLYDKKRSRHPMAQAADADNDGRLDLFVTNYEHPATPNWFYRAKPDGGFADAVNLMGNKAWSCRGATWGDFDDDGDLDIYTANYRLMPNQLWVNDGTGHFKNQAVGRGVAGVPEDGTQPGNKHYDSYRYHGHTIGANWGDLNNDGHLDLVAVNFSHPPQYQDRVQVLINSGPPQYTFDNINAKQAAGIYWQESYAKGAMGDYDNDGDLDLYLSTVYKGDKGELFRNDGQAHFTPVGKNRGVRVPDSYQVTWVDYDHDGFLDLLVGGRLLQNPGNDNHWVNVRLIGDGPSNRMAVGARIRLKTDHGIQIRQITAGQAGNQQPAVAHFGLGQYDQSVAVSVHYPSGRVGHYQAKPDTTLVARESQAK